jgi:hypothetical protein
MVGAPPLLKLLLMATGTGFRTSVQSSKAAIG